MVHVLIKSESDTFAQNTHFRIKGLVKASRSLHSLKTKDRSSMSLKVFAKASTRD